LLDFNGASVILVKKYFYLSTGNNMNYIFYDFETTGISTRYDQFIQLGAIKTDAEFKELDRFEIRCRLLDHIVPAPRALEVTGISPAQLTDPTLDSYYHAVLKLHQKFTKWGPATFIGYNSISFDEEIMRQCFYQNLLPPFLTNTNGNKRADTLTMVKAIRSLAPGSITFPMNDKGKPVLKLEQLAPINGFSHENAHDAIADVEATIFITKLIRDRQPDLYYKLLNLGEKRNVKNIIENNKVLVLVQYYNGSVVTRLVSPLATNPTNSSEVLLFDLSFEPTEYEEQSVDDITKNFKKTKRPYQRIKLNKQPFLFSLEGLPNDISLPNYDETLIKSRTQELALMLKLKVNAAEAMKGLHPTKEGPIELEDQIYDGFPSALDGKLMNDFHSSSWQERPDIVKKFEDRRYQGLARRILLAEEPTLLSQDERTAGEKWLDKRLNDTSGPWKTVEQCISELDSIDCSTLLGKEIKNYLLSIHGLIRP
jgi:exodeoxyribonuclease I